MSSTVHVFKLFQEFWASRGLNYAVKDLRSLNEINYLGDLLPSQCHACMCGQTCCFTCSMILRLTGPFFFFISSTQQNQSCVLLIRDLEQSYYVESRVKLHASFDKDMIYLSQHKTQNVCITYKKIHIFIAILCVNFLRCSSMLPPQDGPIALFIRNTVTEQNFFNPAGHSQAIVLLIKIQIFVRIFIPGRDRSLKEMLLQIILSMIYFNLKHLNRLA